MTGLRIQQAAHSAFTLVELILTISIAAILAVLVVPAIRQLSQSSALTASSLQVIDQLNLARQTALSENRAVEVRFYQLPDPIDTSSTSFRALQLFAIKSGTAVPLDKPSFFSGNCHFLTSATYTNLFAPRSDLLSGNGNGINLPGIGTGYTYLGFRFKPDGSTTLANSLYMTVVAIPARGTSDPPPNWFAVQVDCVTGRIRSFRP